MVARDGIERPPPALSGLYSIDSSSRLGEFKAKGQEKRVRSVAVPRNQSIHNGLGQTVADRDFPVLGNKLYLPNQGAQ
jgi:hypothetical protein